MRRLVMVAYFPFCLVSNTYFCPARQSCRCALIAFFGSTLWDIRNHKSIDEAAQTLNLYPSASRCRGTTCFKVLCLSRFSVSRRDTVTKTPCRAEAEPIKLKTALPTSVARGCRIVRVSNIYTNFVVPRDSISAKAGQGLYVVHCAALHYRDLA